MSEINITQKKQNGVFYTPKYIAEILCNWAIKQQSDLILEPSFGGCNFLESSKAKLFSLGSNAKRITNQLYGCDIDPQAFIYLKQIVTNSNGHFKKEDFLKLKPECFLKSKKFDVVIGNPPYVSQHNMEKDQLFSAIHALNQEKYQISGRASLWAYFVLHSLQFLAENGRMAWILPSSFLFADYSEMIRDEIKGHFSRSLIIQLGERLFIRDGTEEISIITLCDEYHSIKNSESTYKYVYASSNAELNKAITEWITDKPNEIKISTKTIHKNRTKKTLSIYKELSNSMLAKLFGDFCDIQIGIVSGANWFFIVNQNTWKIHNLPSDILSFVLTRFRYSKGITLTKKDVSKIKKQGDPCMLVDTYKVDTLSDSISEYLNSFPRDEFENNSTFRRRSKSGVWHQFNDNHIPDAFFPYMDNEGPSLVLNNARINSSNAIHRIYFNENVEGTMKKVIAISILSTYSQLSAELVGRVYGAGVLKHEPSEVAKIQLLIPPNTNRIKIAILFEKIDKLIRSNKKQEARKLADDFVLQSFKPEEKSEYLTNLLEELMNARRRRIPIKRK